jgi:hypothetical protein
MKRKIMVSAICKATLTLVLLATLFSCKKNPSPPDDSGYNLNVVLRGDAKSLPGSSGYIEFRQDPDTARIIDLNTWVHNLEPNHSYLLQRAVNPVTDPDCSSTAWLTLGLGLQPQDIQTDNHGDGHADLWRAVTSIARGTKFHIHFQVIDATTLSPVLSSDCYDFTVR